MSANSTSPTGSVQNRFSLDQPRATAPFRKQLFCLSICMLLLSVAVIGYGGYREWDASQRLKASLQNLRTNEAERAVVTDRRAAAIGENAGGDQAWAKVIDLSKNSFVGLSYLEHLPIIGGDQRTVFSPDQPWHEEPLVAETLVYLRPILDQLEIAAQHPLPDPARFYSTSFVFRPSLYPVIEQAVKVQQLEIVHALYHRDRERVMRGLDVFSTLASRGKEHWFTADLTNVLDGTSRVILCNSLDFDIWSVDDLDNLKTKFVKPTNVNSEIEKAAQIYRKAIVAQMTVYERDRDRFIKDPLRHVLANLPSAKLAILEDADQLVERSQNGTLLTNYLSHPTPFRQTDHNRTARISLFQAGSSGTHPFEKYTVTSIVDAEDFGRLVLTAMAIKKYQLENGDWPKQLSELRIYGLTDQDYTSVVGNRFGFEVAPQTEAELAQYQIQKPKDAEQIYAWLWIPKPDDWGATSRVNNPSVDTRPQFWAIESRNRSRDRIVRIR